MLPGADSVVEGPQSEGREDGAAFPVEKDRREGPSWHPLWKVAPEEEGRVGGVP